MTDIERDLLVIGAGPVGLYAAYYAGFRGLSTAVVDSLPEPGGQVSAMYPEKPIYDVAGFPEVRGRELVAGLLAQATRFDPIWLLGQSARTLVRGDDGTFEVATDAATCVRCRAVVISGGIGTFTPRALAAGAQWAGRGLSYFVPELAKHSGQHVVVVGGGDSACDWALALETVAASVTLVHRRALFRAHEHTVRQLYASGVRVITDAEVTAVHGDHAVTGVGLAHKDGTVTELPAHSVIAALGFTANLGPIREWKIDVTGNRHIAVDTRMATSLAGVFAAGDIADYPGKLRLMSVGFGEAATAVNNAAVLINPGESLFPGHSSDAVPEPAVA